MAAESMFIYECDRIRPWIEARDDAPAVAATDASENLALLRIRSSAQSADSAGRFRQSVRRC